MQNTFFLRLLNVILTLFMVVAACAPASTSETSPPETEETTEETSTVVSSATPDAVASSTPSVRPELGEDAPPVLPPLMFAIDESNSMVFPGCDQARMRYKIPKLLIDLFADMQNLARPLDQSGVIQPSNLSLYYLDRFATNNNKERIFPNYHGEFETAQENSYWNLIERNSGSNNYVYLFDEMLYEYKAQLMSTDQLAQTPWLIFFTDGYFDDKKEEAISTKRELKEITTYENARVIIFLICPQKYENEYPGVEDFWLQRADESNGKISVIGGDGIQAGINDLMASLLTQVGWPATQNNGSETTAKGWGFLHNAEASINIPAETLHLFAPENYLYLLGIDDFEPPEISFDGQEVYVPKNIYPRDESCGEHFLELKNKFDLDGDQIGFYWWYAEPIVFNEDTEVPPYIYNNFFEGGTAPAIVTTRISLKNLDEKNFVYWQLISECFSVGLSVDGNVVDPLPLQNKEIIFHLPSLGNKKITSLSYVIHIGKKEANGTFQAYQSIRLNKISQSRYIPVINAKNVAEGNCRISEPDGKISTECTTKFSTEFMQADFYPPDLEWLPTVKACGIFQSVLKDTLPDSNIALQAYIDGTDLIVTMNDIEKWGLDSCDKLEISWNQGSWDLLKEDGWIQPTAIVCELIWDSVEKGKKLSLDCN